VLKTQINEDNAPERELSHAEMELCDPVTDSELELLIHRLEMALDEVGSFLPCLAVPSHGALPRDASCVASF
jgi:hypothetical protein